MSYRPSTLLPLPLRLLLVGAMTITMAFFSLRHSPDLTTVNWMPAWLGHWADHHGVLRNTLGFFVYSLVAFLLVGARWQYPAAIGAFSIAIELAQIWIPGRFFDWRDIVASLVGVALAWPFSWPAWRRSDADPC